MSEPDRLDVPRVATVTVAEAADYLSCSERHVHDLLDAGALEFVDVSGPTSKRRRRRPTVRSMRTALENRHQKATSALRKPAATVATTRRTSDHQGMERTIFNARDERTGDGIAFGLDGPDRLTVASVVEGRERVVVVVERGAALRLAGAIIAGLGGTT